MFVPYTYAFYVYKTLTVDVPVVVHIMWTSALGCRLSAVSVRRSTRKHKPARCPVTGTNDCKRSTETVRKLIANNTVVPVDAEIQSLSLRTWRLVDLRTGCWRVWAGTVSSGSCVMVRAQAVWIRDSLYT